MGLIKYERGQVWWCTLPSLNKRGIFQGNHPVVIVSVVTNCFDACQVTICPISTMNTAKEQDKLNKFYTVPVEILHRSYVLVNQIMPAITTDFTGYMGRVTDETMSDIMKKLQEYLEMVVYTYEPKPATEPSSVPNIKTVPLSIGDTKPRSSLDISFECSSKDAEYDTIQIDKDSTTDVLKLQEAEKFQNDVFDERRIIDTTTGHYYHSIKDASGICHMSKSQVRRSCNQGITVSGHKFEYVKK